MKKGCAYRLKLRCDGGPLLRFLRLHRELLRESGAAGRRLFSNPENLYHIEQEDGPAGALSLLVRLHPSERLRELVSALRARDSKRRHVKSSQRGRSVA